VAVSTDPVEGPALNALKVRGILGRQIADFAVEEKQPVR
jgi:hypothetical protein